LPPSGLGGEIAFDILMKVRFPRRAAGLSMSLKNLSRFLPAALALLCSLPGHAQITLNTVPTREIGQPQLLANPFAFPNTNPNLVEGRELNAPYGIALDTSVTPPRLFVADTGNNRVLGWTNAAAFNNGAKADIVIGQRDFFSTGANGPGTTLSTGLAAPTGLAVDQGDLYVADSGNNRILRFRKPFSTPSDQLVPDLCIGQPSFNSRVSNYPAGQPTEKNISLNSSSIFVAAITFDAQRNLWLTDAGNNRVLRYAAADIARGGFTLSANLEIGQLDFISKQPGLPQNQAGLQTLNQLATPAAIAFDPSGRLYIADSDTGSVINRVLVFEPPFTTGMSARRIMGAQPVPVTGAPPRTDAQIYAIKLANPSGLGIFAHPDIRHVRQVGSRPPGFAFGQGSLRPRHRSGRDQRLGYQEPLSQRRESAGRRGHTFQSANRRAGEQRALRRRFAE
jgi:hypothetical protein